MQKGFLRWSVAVLAAGLLVAACMGALDRNGVAASTSPEKGQGQASGTTARRAGPPVVLRVAAPIAAAGHAPVRIALTEEMARRALRRGEMTIDLADGTRYPVRMERVRSEAGGQSTYIGRVQTKAGPQSAVLTFGPDAVFGVLPRPDGYTLAITTTRGVTSIALDGGLVPPGKAGRDVPPDFVVPERAAGELGRNGRARAGIAAIPVHPGNETAATAAAAQEEVDISLLVLYTDELVAMRGSVSAVETEITNLVAIANQAHVDSGSRVRFSLARTAKFEDGDGATNSAVLDAVTDDNAVYGMRDTYSADLVAVVRPYVSGDSSCGIAWLQSAGTQGANADEDLGYSVSDVDESCGRYVFAHELGHNLGSAHDRETAGSAGWVQYGAYKYSFGYRQDDPSFATIMAYTQGRPWLGYFSNPLSTACGTACGVADEADNVRSINRVAPTVAAFRGAPGTVSISDAEGVEGIAGEITWVRVPVRLSGIAPQGGVTFKVEAIGGTASVVADYAAAGTDALTIAANHREADFMLGIVGDDLAEGDETVKLRLKGVSGAGVDDAEALVTIVDDDPRFALEGRVLFPEGFDPPKTSFRVTAFGTEGYPASQRYYEALPPDFHYSFPAMKDSQVELFAWVPEPFVATKSKAGVVSEDTHHDYPVVRGKKVTVRLAVSPGTPVPSGYTNLEVLDSVDGEARVSANFSMMPGDEYETWVYPGAWVNISTTAQAPYLPYKMVDNYVDADFAANVMLSTTYPTLTVWGYSPEAEGDAGSTSQLSAVVGLSAPAPKGGVTFFYHTVSRTAKAGQDYLPVSGIKTIPEGSTGTSIYFDGIGDNAIEPDEYLDFEVANVHNAIVASTQARLFVPTDDFPPPSVLLSATSPASEGAAGTTRTVSVTVALSNPAPEAGVAMFFHTVSGTAKSGQDYAPVSGTLVFAKGETSKTIQVETFGDDVAEADEYFDVAVANVVGGVASRPSARITLVNDDPATAH